MFAPVAFALTLTLVLMLVLTFAPLDHALDCNSND